MDSEFEPDSDPGQAWSRVRVLKDLKFSTSMNNDDEVKTQHHDTNSGDAAYLVMHFSCGDAAYDNMAYEF